MSLLMTLAYLGSLAYTGYVMKEELSATSIDIVMDPSFNEEENKKIIKKHFYSICKRNRIKLDKNKCPYNTNNLSVATNYLKHRGFEENEVKYFTQIFNQRLKCHEKNEIKRIKSELTQMKKTIEGEECNKKVILRRSIYRSNFDPKDRINKLLENDLWNSIVHHQTYIDYGTYWVEVWTLKVPNNFFQDKKKEELYSDVCKAQEVVYTL